MELLVAIFVKPMITTTMDIVTKPGKEAYVTACIPELTMYLPKYANSYKVKPQHIQLTFHWHDIHDLQLYIDDLDRLERKFLTSSDVIHVISNHALMLAHGIYGL
jgi:hypothetical protein